MQKASKAITLAILGSLAGYISYTQCRDDGKRTTTQPGHSHWFWGRSFHGYSGSGSSAYHSSSSRGGFGGRSHFVGG